ncbi:MAG TPA: hypothetical protein VFI42_01230 [Thermomicrobiaceae bacterium]|nr:hypothetical protein [Thermomicrobiaceae bacterium]
MVGLVPVVLLVVTFVVLGQKERAFDGGTGMKIVVAALVITALSAFGLL